MPGPVGITAMAKYVGFPIFSTGSVQRRVTTKLPLTSLFINRKLLRKFGTSQEKTKKYEIFNLITNRPTV
jgi:hypothetical protein